MNEHLNFLIAIKRSPYHNFATFAKKIGVNKSVISLIYNGKRLPTYEQATKIEKALHTTTYDLFGFDKTRLSRRKKNHIPNVRYRKLKAAAHIPKNKVLRYKDGHGT